MKLGIDFGTTRTVVAGIEDGNYPVCTFSWKGEFKEYIPTLVAVKNGVLRFGWDAVNTNKDRQVRLLRSIKRFTSQLRPEDTIDLAPGVSISVLELVTGFLSHLRKMIIHHSDLIFHKRQPLEVMVATPANANSNQRYISMEAFRRAGFVTLGMMNEPSAASVEFVHRYLRNLGPRSPKKYVVIYDLGGGTFDTSVVGLAGRNYDVITHEGIPMFGGDDFDQIILDQAFREAGYSLKGLIGSEEAWLLEECRERKEGLKPNTQKMIVDLGTVLGKEKTVVLNTRRIYERCEPLIESSLDSVHTVMQMLSRIGIDPEDNQSFAAVYLVGGSVAFPPVSRKLRELYGRKVKSSPFPHAATAIGLAITADPRARVRIRESVSRNFGVWREQGKGRDKVFDPIFHKDSRLNPQKGHRKVIRLYRPVHNIGHLRFLECNSLGEAGEPQGDITPWKEIYFPYDPKLKDRKNLTKVPVEQSLDFTRQEVLETYTYDIQGMIRVEIENRTGGYRKDFTLRENR
jgi:molecular chaperone DnaK (HSP70)